MTWFTKFLSSTLGRKLLMALTGLFLILFLAVHLAGNLQLLKDDGGKAFNIYAEFMSTNGLIQFISKGNFFFILLHVFVALFLTIKNRNARGSERYAVTSSKSSIWASRNMGILGTLVLIFIVVHLKDFWAQMHFGSVPVVDYDGKQVRDLASLVDYWFSKSWYVGVYVFCMGALAFHLWHGFESAFQTLGLNHLKYNAVISFVGRAFAIIVPVLFALIPIAMFFDF
ncbi:MAG: succinate dehydrogenase cytochrome b subunit [Cyclobacteriaceae bacterium]|nr:succinate dehydrogenase cytochrome b subunit [Cyclobacteriaceae bacterium]UYN86059.1 MAG: succinate dehydrogenase cytochrome b subunit [Cyclobacteriaceae bacterium]